MGEVVVSHVSKTYGRGRRSVLAVDDVSFTAAEGKTLAIIGESGSGKSTLGRLVLGAERADQGEVRRGGQVVSSGGKADASRQDASLVLQEPELALNPRMTVGEIVMEPLNIHNRSLSRDERRERGQRALDRVHLGPELWGRYRSQLSGGQQQRVGIARAIISEPRFVVLDEPTASLDLSVRGKVLDTLKQLQEEMGLTYVLITHDMATVSALADDVVVLRHGRVVETGAWSRVRREPEDDYTKRLLSSVLAVHR